MREISYPKIRKFKALFFWYECRFCNKEFRKQINFEIIDKKPNYGIPESSLQYTYCCKNCAKTEQEVLDLINNQKMEAQKRYEAFIESIGKNIMGKDNTKNK